MLYGFTGAHRSGKTTLAAKVAERLSIEFMPIKTTEVALANGFDPVAPMSLFQRMELQLVLFENFIKKIENAPRPLIVDRTPLDHVTYLLTEIAMRSSDEVSMQALDNCYRFVDLAMSSVKQYFDCLFYTAPLPTYEEDPTKPPANRLYQFHYAMVMQGLLSGTACDVNRVFLPMDDLETRVATVEEVIAQRLEAIVQMRRSMELH